MSQPELYRTHRPTRTEDVVGQDAAVKTIESWFTVARRKHGVILSGPSGVGKTTLARILKEKLRCHDDDFYEINAADFRGVDTARDIRQKMNLAPLVAGGARIWLLDEAHKLTSDAQTAMLKMIEDAPSHVYFVLCTTEPDRLIPTVQTRCQHVRLKSLLSSELVKVLQRVVKEADLKDCENGLLIKIADAAGGSARRAIQLLDQLSAIDPDDRLAVLAGQDKKKDAFAIVKALLWEGKGKRPEWRDVAALINGLDENEEWEGLRRLVLNMAAKECLKAGKSADRAYLILTCFEEPWFNSGKAGLVRACYEVLHRD